MKLTLVNDIHLKHKNLKARLHPQSLKNPHINHVFKIKFTASSRESFYRSEEKKNFDRLKIKLKHTHAHTHAHTKQLNNKQNIF